MEKIMELRNIDKIYGTQIQTQVLYDINLSFEQGSFNSIIGQSGSGKSTLLNIMGTLDRPTNGQVLIRGIPANEMTENELADLRNISIGFVFQFHYLLPEFTAIENVLMPFQIQTGKITKEIRNKAEEYMDLVGLSQVRNNPSSKMSGGQQQRTAIARALINRPSIILADEPTGNLDSDSTETIYELMRDINQKLGTTFIIITHDRRIAEKADRIVEIKDGRINLDIRK